MLLKVFAIITSRWTQINIYILLIRKCAVFTLVKLMAGIFERATFISYVVNTPDQDNMKINSQKCNLGIIIYSSNTLDSFWGSPSRILVIPDKQCQSISRNTTDVYYNPKKENMCFWANISIVNFWSLSNSALFRRTLIFDKQWRISNWPVCSKPLF